MHDSVRSYTVQCGVCDYHTSLGQIGFTISFKLMSAAWLGRIRRGQLFFRQFFEARNVFFRIKKNSKSSNRCFEKKIYGLINMVCTTYFVNNCWHKLLMHEQFSKEWGNFQFWDLIFYVNIFLTVYLLKVCLLT